MKVDDIQRPRMDETAARHLEDLGTIHADLGSTCELASKALEAKAMLTEQISMRFTRSHACKLRPMQL